MRNLMKGVENYDAEARTFDYAGYHVKFDGHYAHITGKDGETITRQHMSWQAEPRDNESAIDWAKGCVLEIDQESRPSDWRKRMELESMMRSLSRSELSYPTTANDLFVEAFEYRDHIIKIHYDTGTTCPWDDWDGEPSALKDWQGAWRTMYGKNEIAFDTKYGSIGEEEAMRYIRIFLRGVCRPFWTSGGGIYIAFWSGEEVEEHFGGDYHKAAHALKMSCETFKSWAEGDVYGYTIDAPEGEGDSCWGFYGNDYGYMLESAMDQVNYSADRLEEEKRAMDEEIDSMMESELGFRPTREGALA